MATYVLVHGAFHGGWCWHKVLPLLEQAGHTAIAVDLPGHGEDTAPVGQQSLQTYADRVISILDAQPEPVRLVGHSMSGMVITLAAELCPQKIATLVYLAAYLPRDGLSALQLVPSEQSIEGPDALAVVDPGSGIVVLNLERARQVFYADCSEEDIAYANARLCPETLAAGVTPVTITPERFGSVPRVYITTTRDHYAASMATGHVRGSALPKSLFAGYWARTRLRCSRGLGPDSHQLVVDN